VLQVAQRLVGVLGDVEVLRQPLAGAVFLLDGLGDRPAELVVRQLAHRVEARPRRHHAPQKPCEARYLQVVEQALKRLLHLRKRILHAPVQERLLLLRTAFFLEARKDGGAEVHPREDVGEATGDLFLPLQRAAEAAHRQVGKEGEAGRRPRHLAVVRDRRPAHGTARQTAAGEAEAKGAEAVAHDVPDVAPERIVEFLRVALHQRLNFLQRVGVASDRPLPEDHHRACEDVRPLHRDADGKRLVGKAEQVVGAARDGIPRQHVHPIVHEIALHLHDRRHHARLLAPIHRPVRVVPRRVHDVGVARDARQRLLDALELADGETELLADGGVSPRHAGHKLAAAHGLRRQHNAAARRQRVHEHGPALARALFPSDNGVDGQHHVLALRRAVKEGHPERIVAAPEPHARRVRGHKGAGDPQVLALAQVILRIVQLKRQSEHAGDGRQRDVALLPVEAQLQLAVLVLKHCPGRLHRPGVRPRVRLGEGERRQNLAARQPREVAVLLLVGAVVEKQFARSQRIGHHHRNGEGHGVAAQFLHHRTPGRHGESLPAILLRNDEAKEALFLQVVPRLGRQVAALVNLPVVHHLADLFAGPIQERLLLIGKLRIQLVERFIEVGFPRKQLPLHPHCTRVDRRLLGLRDSRQELKRFHQPHDAGRHLTAKRTDIKNGHEDAVRDPHPQRRTRAVKSCGPGERPRPQRRAGVTEHKEHEEHAEDDTKQRHAREKVEEGKSHGGPPVGQRMWNRTAEHPAAQARADG